MDLRGDECGADAYHLDGIFPTAWAGEVEEGSVEADVQGGGAVDTGCGGEDEPDTACEEGEEEEAIAGYVGAGGERAGVEKEDKDVGGVPQGREAEL